MTNGNPQDEDLEKWAENLPTDIDELIEEIKTKLKKKKNPLKWYARYFAFLTTPLKYIGFSGWEDLGVRVRALGHITNRQKSSDRFVTVDMTVKEFEVKNPISGNWVNGLPEGPNYIRMEVRAGPRDEAKKKDPPREIPDACNDWAFAGRLMLDRDAQGHLEIHPETGDDIMSPEDYEREKRQNQ
jgi:hypothetical protein